MIATATPHPSASQLHAYSEGRLDPETADAVERHVAGCDSCCRLLEGAPADSFVGRLRDARRPVDSTDDAGLGTVTEASEMPPELIDHPRYRVLGLIGQGGMGAVYRAEHRRMERPVALKVINPGLMRNPATVERFQQEVRAAARLHHPNIVTAFDADQAGNPPLHFLVMEYVEGKSLADLVQERGPLPAAEACEYVRQAALGLQHAHEQGMVHRDVKPHNLMLTPGGVVKILDFGLARLARTPDAEASGSGVSDASLTGAGVVMGSADYIAPEQAADPRSADVRADVYALGCTLFHLLAGRPPFPDGTVQEKLARHAGESLPPLPVLPPGLAAVLARMTAKDPGQRFATPAGVAQALAPFCETRGVRSTIRQRLRWAVAVAALLVAGLLAAGIVLRIQTDRGEIVIQTDDDSVELIVGRGGKVIRIRDPKTKQAWEIDTTKERIYPDNLPEGGFTIALKGRGEITLRRGKGGKITVESRPEVVADPGQPRPLTDEERRQLSAQGRPLDDVILRTGGLLPEVLARRPNAADALKRSDIPEKALAYLCGGDPKKVPRELVAVLTAAPAPLPDVRFRCPKGAGRPGFSPDGKLLAVPTEGMVLFFDAVSGRLVRSAKGLWDLRARVGFSSDGRKLAVGSKAEDFCLLDVGTGKALWRLKETQLPDVGGFAFSADGKQIAFRSSSSSRVEVYAVGSGKKVRSFRGPGKKIVSMAFATDPVYFATVALGAPNPWQVNVHSPEVPRGGYGTLFSHLGVRVAFRPDGKLLAVAHKEEKGGTCMVSFYHPDDRFSSMCGYAPIPGADVLAFTPDGKELVAAAFQGGNVVIGRCQAPKGRIFETKTVVLPTRGPAEWAVSSDGKTLAVSVKGEPFVRLIDIETGKPRVSDAGHTGAVIALACSADGKRMVSAWDDGRVIVWDLATGRPVVRWKLDARLRRLAISPNGRLVATACEAPANSANKEDWVHLWDASGGMTTQVLSGHAGAVTDLAFSPDGKLLATASADRTVRLWGVEDGKEVAGVVHPKQVRTVAWSADGQLLASWSTDGTWIVREVKKRTEHRHLDHTPPWSAAFDLEGQRLAILSLNGTRPVVGLYKWKEWTGNERARGLTGPRSRLHGGPGATALGPGPFLAAVADRLDGSLLVWQTQPLPNPTREKRFTLAPPGSGPLRCVAFSPEGRYVMAGGADGLIRVLRLAERGKVPEIPAAK